MSKKIQCCVDLDCKDAVLYADLDGTRAPLEHQTGLSSAAIVTLKVFGAMVTSLVSLRVEDVLRTLPVLISSAAGAADVDAETREVEIDVSARKRRNAVSR